MVTGDGERGSRRERWLNGHGDGMAVWRQHPESHLL
jgi:hypothetical protein